jgi:hypothetical protein
MIEKLEEKVEKMPSSEVIKVSTSRESLMNESLPQGLTIKLAEGFSKN